MAQYASLLPIDLPKCINGASLKTLSVLVIQKLRVQRYMRTWTPRAHVPLYAKFPLAKAHTKGPLLRKVTLK